MATNAVLTLDDLDTWRFEGTCLAVLGHPIKHSISPAMHTAALADMARLDPRFSNWKYVKFDVPPEHLPQALDRLHAKGFFGLNLTVPHKVLAFSRVGCIDPAALPIGAVNTLRREPLGWKGFNTDGYGLCMAVRETLNIELAGSHVILVGAGGAARGAAVECLQKNCRSLWIGNRSTENLDRLLADLRGLSGSIPVHGFSTGSTPLGIPSGALLINATSAGLRPDDPLPIPLTVLPKPAGVYDMIYNPAETPLLRTARSLQIPASNGLSMLVHQGVRALEIWSEASVPVGAMREAAMKAMAW
ncbi:MAG TPA: shikimate dehydrogenase [Opitutaceae bacterium]|nr:shikimate dehydrogenase [Opitutaceae bacterium]